MGKALTFKKTWWNKIDGKKLKVPNETRVLNGGDFFPMRDKLSNLGMKRFAQGGMAVILPGV